MNTIGIVGFGNMGEAFAAGLRSSMPDVVLNVHEPIPYRSQVAATSYDAAILSLDDVLGKSEVTILAVKPQIAPSVSLMYSGSGAHLISIMAGKTLSWIEKSFRTDQAIRFMPSIAAKVNKSVVAFCPSPTADQEFVDQGKQIAAAVGEAIELPERLMSAFTGLSGSGIAYVFSFIHALALGGTKTGIPYAQSVAITLSTMRSAIELVETTNEHPVSLLSKVISPAGTTIEGILALEEGGMTATVMDAVERAAIRAADFED